MGLFSNILLAPIKGPLNGLVFVSEKLAEAVDNEHSGPEAIKRRYVALEAQLNAGEITEEEFEEEEIILLTELKNAQAAQKAQAQKRAG